MLINSKILTKKCLGLSLSGVVFIMLINVKMPTKNCWHFNIYEQDKFSAQLKFSVLQQNPIVYSNSIQGTLLSIS